MRRTATWLLIAAVVALGLAAAVDAFRQEPEPVGAGESPSTGGPSRQQQLAMRQLREAGVSGVLTYSDDDCRLRAVSLPELEPVRAPSFAMCRPATSTGGLTAIDGEVVWAGLGYGTADVVLSREALSRAVRRDYGFPVDDRAGFRAVRATGLERGRYVVLADSSDEPRERVLAAFQGRRALFVHPGWWVGDAQAIRPSSTGRYYALLGRDPPVFTSGGHEVGLPAGVPPARAVAWSPDDRWTAVAAQASVYVFPSEARTPVVRIPLAVHDLDWASAEGSSSP
ncbi:MAG: hypothetical protein ACRDMY_08380 [Gaiellaceae bacterium]